MGTLNDKIHYLQDTKDDIKDAIVAQGISVASTDTFRSYADKISQIQGGGAVYTAGNNVQIENCVISATDTTYTAGDGIEISASNIISTNALPDGTPIYYVNNTDTTQTAFITSITPTLNQMYADVRNNLQPQLYLTTTYKYLDTDSINGLYSFNQNYIASGNYMLQNSNKWNLNTMSADSYNTMQLETHAFIASITTPGTVDSWLDVPLSQTGGATYFLNPTTTYTTPFIPTDAGHPATKKYVDDNVYTLPTASTTVLGGVKVDGTTIDIDENGVISGSSSYTLPTAAADTLGGVKLSEFIGLDANSKLNPNVHTYVWDGTSGVTTPANIVLFQKVYDDIIAGNTVEIICDTDVVGQGKRKVSLSLFSISGNIWFFRGNALTFVANTNSYTQDTVGGFGSTITIDTNTVTTVSAIDTNSYLATRNFLETNMNYSVPYMPLYDGSPATKKYVDDNIPDEYTLPTASTTVLGGVKVDGTSISITNGVISGANTLAKALGSDINTGTDDTKYITSKAVTDSKISITDHTETLTNKAIVKRVVTTTDDATAVIDVGVTDIYELSAIANATTFSTTGSPTDGQKLMIRFKDAGAAKALTWDAVFVAIGVTAPTTTVAGKWHYVGCEYNAAATKWHILAVAVQS